MLAPTALKDAERNHPVRLFCTATWRIIRRRTRGRCIKAFIKWRTVVNVSFVTDIAQRQVARRTVLLEKIKDAYWRDIISTREYLSKHGKELKDAENILSSIPSLNLRAVHEDVRRHLNVRYTAAQDKLKYVYAEGSTERFGLEIGEELKDYGFVVRSCEKCQGLAQFVASRNQKVERAIRALDKKEKREKRLDEAREQAAELLKKLSEREARIVALEYELHEAKVTVFDEQQKLE